MEKNGPVRVSYEAKSKNPIDVGTFVFTVSVKLYMEICVNITKIRLIPKCQYSSTQKCVVLTFTERSMSLKACRTYCSYLSFQFSINMITFYYLNFA